MDFKRNLLKISPITYVTKAAAPILIFHAADDDIMNCDQVPIIMEKLKSLQVDTKYVQVRKGGHEVPCDVKEVDMWFQNYLK